MKYENLHRYARLIYIKIKDSNKIKKVKEGGSFEQNW